MKKDTSARRTKKGKSVSYAKWGYIFLIPFFVIYITCTLVPQFNTIYNSLFENYMSGLRQIGPEYVGLENYITVFSPDKAGNIGILKYAGNTMIMWLMGAIPQFVIALVLAVWFTSYRLNIKGQPFFKTVIYMPNLIMASAFSMLFFTLFSNVGPVNQLLVQSGILEKSFDFFQKAISVRSLVAAMNFLMWFGNTTILLMAGIMGIDQTIFEAATIDGASSTQVFFRVTLPLLMPIMTYVFITAMIGGIQMFDVPTILTNNTGNPNRDATTVIMYLNNYLKVSKNYGMSGAISVVLFFVTGILGIFVYNSMTSTYRDDKRTARLEKKMAKKMAKKGAAA